MVVKVPYLITAYPSAHSWNRHEAAEEKVFAVKVTDAEPMQIVSYTVSSKNFDCQLETVKEGFEYKIAVTPSINGLRDFLCLLSNFRVITLRQMRMMINQWVSLSINELRRGLLLWGRLGIISE